MNLCILVRILSILLVFPSFVYVCGCSSPNDNSVPSNSAPLTFTLASGDLNDEATGQAIQSRYTVGASALFNVIELGKTIRKLILTPIEPLPDGVLNALKEQNIARFTQMIDTDGNLNNGTVPSMNLLTVLLTFNWLPVSFLDKNLTNRSTEIQLFADLSSVDKPAHSTSVHILALTCGYIILFRNRLCFCFPSIKK